MILHELEEFLNPFHSLYVNIYLLVVGPSSYIHMVKTQLYQLLDLLHLPFDYRLIITYHPHGIMIRQFNEPLYEALHTSVNITFMH